MFHCRHTEWIMPSLGTAVHSEHHYYSVAYPVWPFGGSWPPSRGVMPYRKWSRFHLIIHGNLSQTLKCSCLQKQFCSVPWARLTWTRSAHQQTGRTTRCRRQTSRCILVKAQRRIYLKETAKESLNGLKTYLIYNRKLQYSDWQWRLNCDPQIIYSG